jgi:hypothetical protein
MEVILLVSLYLSLHNKLAQLLIRITKRGNDKRAR